MFNWGRIEDEFNSHGIGFEGDEDTIYMMWFDDDIDMNWFIIMRGMGTILERKGKKLWGKGRAANWKTYGSN